MADLKKMTTEPSSPPPLKPEAAQAAPAQEVKPAVQKAKTAAPAEPDEPKLPKFLVSWQDKSAEIEAPNDREAWAVFCDGMKKWPNPKSGKVLPIV